MNDQRLRKNLIRLAHENPGPVRDALMPILKGAGASFEFPDVDPASLSMKIHLLEGQSSVRVSLDGDGGRFSKIFPVEARLDEMGRPKGVYFSSRDAVKLMNEISSVMEEAMTVVAQEGFDAQDEGP